MATAFNRVRYLYQLGDTDTASFDLSVAGDAPGGLITDYGDLLTYATNLQDLYTLDPDPDPYQYLKSNLNEHDHFTGVNAQYVVGTQVIASAYAQLATPLAGQSEIRLPLQSAWVVSLRTNEAGRSARGRCYYPATGLDIDEAGLMTITLTSDFANGFGNLMADVCSQHADPTAQIQVYSRVEDVLRPVTRVLVDGAPDTQRRRRDKLQAPYQTSTTYPV